MSIETKTRIVVLWTIASVIALLFLTGCFEPEPVSVHVESSTGRCIVMTNTHIGGEFDTPHSFKFEQSGHKIVLINGWMNGYVWVTVKSGGDVLGTYEGQSVYFEVYSE